MSAALAVVYLLCLVASLTALAVALRPRPAPPPPRPAVSPAQPAPVDEADVRAILTAAARLAARLTPAA